MFVDGLADAKLEGEGKGGEGIRAGSYTSAISYFRSFTLPYLEAPENPSCLQATLASVEPKPSSHTVPHSPHKKISSRPAFTVVKDESTSLKPPSSSDRNYIYKMIQAKQSAQMEMRKLPRESVNQLGR